MNTPGDDSRDSCSIRTSARSRSKGRSTRTAPTDTPSRRKIFVCRPTTRARGRRVRAHDRLDARAARVPPAGDCRGRRGADGVLSRRAASEGGSFDDGIETALQRILADPEFIYRGEPEPAERGGRQELSHQRPRAGVAAVVLPLEQHPGRRAARRWRRRASCKEPAVLEQQVRRMLADPKSRGAGRRTSPASG